MTTKKTDRRKNAKPPAVRGRRGHSSIDQQKGLAEKIDAMLMQSPRPTYDEMIEQLRATGFWVSRSSLARYGMKFEIRRREMKLLVDKARLLSQDDPESVLELERAIANLANVKIFESLLDPNENVITEAERDVMNVAARIASSSSSRERAKLAFTRGIKAASQMLRNEMEKALKSEPEALKIVLRAIDRASKATEAAKS